jgi:putative addiction module component (TIGR02574 family)
MSYRKVLEAALELSTKDRAKLIERLHANLEYEAVSDLGEEWLEEINRRAAEMESGKVKGIPWEEVRRKTREKLEVQR